MRLLLGIFVDKLKYLNQVIKVKGCVSIDDETLKNVKEILSKQLGIETCKIDGNTSIMELGADSLDKVEIIFAIEKKFHIKIQKEKFLKINTANDIVEAIKEIFL